MVEHVFVVEIQGKRLLSDKSLDSNLTEKIVVREYSEKSATLTRF